MISREDGKKIKYHLIRQIQNLRNKSKALMMPRITIMFLLILFTIPAVAADRDGMVAKLLANNILNAYKTDFKEAGISFIALEINNKIWLAKIRRHSKQTLTKSKHIPDKRTVQVKVRYDNSDAKSSSGDYFSKNGFAVSGRFTFLFEEDRCIEQNILYELKPQQ